MKKTALVLSGGGARGIAHIGVIEELEKQGCEIDSISGTSMGAMVGGVYALGKLEEFKRWLFSADRMMIFKLIDFSHSRQGLVKGDKILNAMQEFISDANIEDLKIPYSATACDLVNEKEVVFRSGSIFEAIRASIAIPAVFTPVVTENGLLVDGGVMNNIPVNNVERTKGDILIVVNVNAHIPAQLMKQTREEKFERKTVYLERLKSFRDHLAKFYPHEKREGLGYFNILDKTLALMMDQIAQASLKNYSPDLVINISRWNCSTYDFFKAEELVEIGRMAARNVLAAQKKA